MKSKYHNKKVMIDGIKFDSKKEANRYQELKLMQRAGIISDLQRQVKYVLIPSQKGDDGRVVERPCTYIADFVYVDENGKKVVEDTKGYRTSDYKIKRKLMLYIHGVKINEI